MLPDACFHHNVSTETGHLLLGLFSLGMNVAMQCLLIWALFIPFPDLQSPGPGLPAA